MQTCVVRRITTLVPIRHAIFLAMATRNLPNRTRIHPVRVSVAYEYPHEYLAYRSRQRASDEPWVEDGRIALGISPGGILPLDTIIEGDCIAALERLPARVSISSSRTPPIIFSSAAIFSVPTTQWSTPSTTIGINSPPFASLRRLHQCLARRRQARDEARCDALGDRLLPQHLPRGRQPAGSRLLDPQRYRLAQNGSDAELPRQAFHQCARDPDLGLARPALPLYLQLRGSEGW